MLVRGELPPMLADQTAADVGSGHMVSYTRTIRISPHCLKPVVNGLAPGAAVNENPV